MAVSNFPLVYPELNDIKLINRNHSKPSLLVNNKIVSSVNLKPTAPSAWENSTLISQPTFQPYLDSLFKSRNIERLQLSTLNDRFASYIERIRFLEVQNRLLEIEHNALLSRFSKPYGKSAELFQKEIKQAHRLLDDIQRETDVLSKKVYEAESNLEILHSQLVDTNSNDIREDIVENERVVAETHMKAFILNRRLHDLEYETTRFRREINRVTEDLNRLHKELQSEIGMKNSMQLKRAMLENEIELQREIYNEEISDVKSELLLMKTFDPEGYFKNSLADAMRHIREEYNVLNHKLQTDLKNRYALIYNELALLPTENTHLNLMANRFENRYAKKLKEMLEKSQSNVTQLLQNNAKLRERVDEQANKIEFTKSAFENVLKKKDAEIDKLRKKLKNLTDHYDNVVHARVSLEAEIQRYQDLLDGTSQNQGLKDYVAGIGKTFRNNKEEFSNNSYRKYSMGVVSAKSSAEEISHENVFLDSFRSFRSYNSNE